MRSENQVHKRITFANLLNHRRLLHHTAAERDLHPGIFLLVSVQLAESAVYLLVCIVTDRAGIEDHKISLFAVDDRKACLLQNTDQFFGVSGIHLTAERGDAAGRRMSKLGGKDSGMCPGLLQIIILSGRFVAQILFGLVGKLIHGSQGPFLLLVLLLLQVLCEFCVPFTASCENQRIWTPV